MSSTLALPDAEPAPADWLAGLEPRPRRGARRLAAVLLALAIALLALGAAAWAWQANEPALSTTLAAPSDDGGGAVFKARLEPRRHRVMLTPVGGFDTPAAKRVRRLWLMRVYGPPIPLGLVDPRRTTTLPIAPALLPADNPPTHLFVSLEQTGEPLADYPKGPTAAEGALSGR